MFFDSNIDITFSTFDPYVLNNLAPLKGARAIPKWFKDTLPFNGEGSISEHFEPIKCPTIRRCPAVNDYFNTGITIPLWTDLEFYIDPAARHMEWRYSNVYEGIQLVQPHDSSQFPALAGKYLHAKIISPWIAHCNKSIKWFQTKPAYLTSEYDNQNVIFCDGVIQYKNNFVTHTNLFFPITSSSYTVKFTAGTPFQKIIPLTEKNVNMKVEYCTKEYYMHASLFGRKISYYLGKLYNTLKSKEK